MPPKPPEPLVLAAPLFKALLWIVASVMFSSLVIMTLLALLGSNPATDAQESLMGVCQYGFTTTLGAIIGLLCGRVAGPDAVVPPPTPPPPPPQAGS